MRRIVFDVPKWHVFLHRDSRGIDHAADRESPLCRFEDELFDRLYSGDGERLPDDQQDPRFAAWADTVHRACGDLPAFQRLGAECRGDAFAAGLGVEELMGVLQPQLPRDGGDVTQSAHPTQASSASDASNVPPGAALRRGLGTGCRKASDAIEAQRETFEGLSGVGMPGTESGSSASLPSRIVRDLAHRLRSDPRLQRIALLAGRFKRIAAAKRKTRLRHGADEIADIGQGADLDRLLPSELIKIAHPVLRMAFLRSWVERSVVQYELTGNAALGKGPLVVVLDKSGSMDGDRDVWATALALALLDQARHERRPFALVGFDCNIKFEAVVPVGQPLPEAGLFVGCGGGTDIGLALRRGLAIIGEKNGKLGKADIVLVTDGESDVSSVPELREQAQAAGVTILGLGIGVGRGQLSPWCDEIQVVGDLSGIDDASAERLFAA